MKNIVFIFFICCYSLSCYTPRYVYSPPTQNIPGLIKKNDVEIAIGRDQVMEKLRRFVTVYDNFLNSVCTRDQPDQSWLFCDFFDKDYGGVLRPAVHIL